MNKVIISKDNVIKQFDSAVRFYNEIDMRNNFSGNFKIPEIVGLNNVTLTIEYEKIDCLSLSKFTQSLDLEQIIDLISYIPVKEGNRKKWDQKLFLLSKIREDYLIKFIKGVNINSNCLMHGDFRPHNILKSEKGIYLIDFEFSDYGDKERDMAYFYNGLLYFNPLLARDYFNLVKKTTNYPNFLFYCLFYNHAARNNPLSDKEALNIIETDIKKEIKKL